MSDRNNNLFATRVHYINDGEVFTLKEVIPVEPFVEEKGTPVVREKLSTLRIVEPLPAELPVFEPSPIPVVRTAQEPIKILEPVPEQPPVVEPTPTPVVREQTKLIIISVPLREIPVIPEQNPTTPYLITETGEAIFANGLHIYTEKPAFYTSSKKRLTRADLLKMIKR
jgi:hypothetical protein